MFRRIKAYKCLRWEESIVKVIRNYAELKENEDQLKLCDDALYTIQLPSLSIADADRYLFIQFYIIV